MVHVKTITRSGPPVNVVDLVFLAEGYDSESEGKFNADVKRLVDAVFFEPGSAFHSFVPIFNIHSVYVASGVSGVGKGAPRDTAFRLFREGNTFRSILPSHGSYAKADELCLEAPGCDFAVILVNGKYFAHQRPPCPPP